MKKLTAGARRSVSIASLSDSFEISRCNAVRSATVSGLTSAIASVAVVVIGVDSFESRDNFEMDVGVSGTGQLNSESVKMFSSTEEAQKRKKNVD